MNPDLNVSSCSLCFQSSVCCMSLNLSLSEGCLVILCRTVICVFLSLTISFSSDVFGECVCVSCDCVRMMGISVYMTVSASGCLSLIKWLHNIFIEQQRKHHMWEGIENFTEILAKLYKGLRDWLKQIPIDPHNKRHCLSASSCFQPLCQILLS